MKVLKDGNGDLLVKVSNSDWYNYVGTRKYVPEIAVRNFDTVTVKDRSLKKAIKACIDYNSCVDNYWRDQSGKLLRRKSINTAIDMLNQVEVISEWMFKYDPLSLYVGLYVPFTDGKWRLITRITDDMVKLDGKNTRNKRYVISEMIGYMNACLPNKNGVDTIISDFNGNLHTVINGCYVEDSEAEDNYDYIVNKSNNGGKNMELHVGDMVEFKSYKDMGRFDKNGLSSNCFPKYGSVV